MCCHSGIYMFQGAPRRALKCVTRYATAVCAPRAFVQTRMSFPKYYDTIFDLSSNLFNHFTLLYIAFHTPFLHRLENKEASSQITAMISKKKKDRIALRIRLGRLSKKSSIHLKVNIYLTFSRKLMHDQALGSSSSSSSSSGLSPE